MQQQETIHAVMAPLDDDSIKSRILTIRGVQVMLSSDLSLLYDVEVKYLHRQVKRNANRFPSDFVIHLSPDEANALRCQNVTSKRGGDRYGLLAFTEQGIAMLSSVLKSDRAAEMNVAIMRAFVAMRRTVATLAPLLARIEAAERRQLK
ncbi:MAG: ORF6N domain-containing protein, partial [Paludibacteraceae bacterium]|nr:ORF6N domain-containing protein [Paludibacteraceae bacterium]